MNKEEIKTRADLIDKFVEIARVKGYSDYSGDAERFINETVHKYENLPEQERFTIPKRIADELDREGYIVTGGVMPRTWELEVQGTLEAVKRIAIARLYLIGKELGLNFVEVVEEPEAKYKCIECGLHYYYGDVRRANYGYDYICDTCYDEEEK